MYHIINEKYIQIIKWKILTFYIDNISIELEKVCPWPVTNLVCAIFKGFVK